MTSQITIHFEHDATHDVHIVYPCCHIESEADCIAWLERYSQYCTPLGHKVDMIIVLDMFSVDPAITPVWAEYRAEMLTRFSRYSVRVHSDSTVASAVVAGSAKHGVSADIAPDIPTALAHIMRCRRRRFYG